MTKQNRIKDIIEWFNYYEQAQGEPWDMSQKYDSYLRETKSEEFPTEWYDEAVEIFQPYLDNLEKESSFNNEMEYSGYDCYDTQLRVTYNTETKEITVGTFEREYDLVMDIKDFDAKLSAGEIQFFKK